MPLAIKNDKSQGRYIFFKVNGVMQKEWFEAFEERIIQNISTVDQLANKESAAKRKAIEKAGPARAGLISSRGGFIKDITENDIFEGKIVTLRDERRLNTLYSIGNNNYSLFTNSRDIITAQRTELFNKSTSKVEPITGWFMTDTAEMVQLSRGIVKRGYDLSHTNSKPQLSRAFYQLFADTGVDVSQAQVTGAIALASATGSTGTTGTTTGTSGNTGTTWTTGTTTGVTSGITTGTTTGTTEPVTGYTGGTCYTSVDLLGFLSCFGASTSGITSGCSIYDYNLNGTVDSADLLTFLSNWCYSGTT